MNLSTTTGFVGNVECRWSKFTADRVNDIRDERGKGEDDSAYCNVPGRAVYVCMYI